MLSFDEKSAILESFPELQRKEVSLGRVNYHFEGSVSDKKNVAYHLHPNGNGFVYAGRLKGYATDGKGFVNIREFSAEALRTLVAASIRSLSEEAPAGEGKSASARSARKAKEQTWKNRGGQSLRVVFEDDLWYVYSGPNLESAFETCEEVEEYMREEGFERD